jgi:hypothetical protein
MKCKVINNTSRKMPNLMTTISNFLSFAHEKMNFNKPVDVELVSDTENGQILLGKSAYYDPIELKIAIFVDNRHPKDILRSISHELMHHTQNCRGDFEKVGDLKAGYAQKDDHMRNMEEEAYKAAIILRDFEDLTKKEEKDQLTLDEWKNLELFEILLEKFVPITPNNDLKVKDKQENTTFQQDVKEVIAQRMRKISS